MRRPCHNQKRRSARALGCRDCALPVYLLFVQVRVNTFAPSMGHALSHAQSHASVAASLCLCVSASRCVCVCVCVCRCIFHFPFNADIFISFFRSLFLNKKIHRRSQPEMLAGYVGRECNSGNQDRNHARRSKQNQHSSAAGDGLHVVHSLHPPMYVRIDGSAGSCDKNAQ